MKQDVLLRIDEIHWHATCFKLCSAESTVENKFVSWKLIIQEEFMSWCQIIISAQSIKYVVNSI